MRFLAITAVLLLLGMSVSAEDSLYRERESRTLGERLRRFFGPKSAEVRYDERMIRAAEIAMRRAEPKKTWYCWRYVKKALLAAGVVDSYPSSAWAKNAGEELCRKYGFTKLDLRDPYDAPVGAVIVYGGKDAGHVELRSDTGFVSDFVSPTPYPRPLVGIYVKPS